MFAKIKAFINNALNFVAANLAIAQVKAITFFGPSINSVFRKAGAPKATAKDYVKTVAAAFAFVAYLVTIAIITQVLVYVFTVVLAVVLAFWLANLVAAILTMTIMFTIILRAGDMARVGLSLFAMADKMEAGLNSFAGAAAA